jgi:hypothetical protein
MAFATYVLMFAGISQTLVGCATAQDSSLTLFDILPAYVRHLSGQLEQQIYRTIILREPFANGMFASQEAEGAAGAVSDESGMLPRGQ